MMRSYLENNRRYKAVLYATDRKEGFVGIKLQCGLSSMKIWCKRWNVKINEDKTQGIYFSRSRSLTLNERYIPFVNSVKYLGVIFDRRVTWRLHIEMIEAKAFTTFVRDIPYSEVSD
jgi:hypothetical protein